MARLFERFCFLFELKLMISEQASYPKKENYSSRRRIEIHPILAPTFGYRSDVDPSLEIRATKTTRSDVGSKSLRR